ncbi:MAG: DUF2207 domain-containing protein [Bacilli bacterium]|nr:DUF2207 domain-containing protein [Bacilli bacterium]
MKKFIFGLLVFIFGTFAVYGNSIYNIDMDIFIDDDGTAIVTEYWDMYNSEGTENYKSYGNLGESTIADFRVSLGNISYEPLTYWDIDESFSYKAYKSGINHTSEGLELCWGISKYGRNTYKLTYEISNFVVNVSDAQMIYWTLISQNMDPAPRHYDITINSNYYFEDSIEVWGYGVKGDYAYVSNGEIKLSAEDAMDSDEYVVLLAKIPSGTFQTTASLENDFDHYSNMAQKGSSSFNKILAIIIEFVISILGFLPYVLVFVLIAKKASNNQSKYTKLRYEGVSNKVSKDNPMFREIPCEKDIYIASYISNAYKLDTNKSNFIGCLLLKWIKDNIIRIEKNEKGRNVIRFMYKVLPDEYTAYDSERDLFNWMHGSSVNEVLEKKEFVWYCKNHYKSILEWTEDNFRITREILSSKGWITTKQETGTFKINHRFATPKLYEEACKIDGLKKYLIEFSNIKEKEPIEVHLWKEYLMFAQLFGIAEKVAKQFKDFYPEINEIADFDYDTFVFVDNFSYSSYHSATSARSAAMSYSSGGGGFSSGGGGGGSFGGGGGGGGSR